MTAHWQYCLCYRESSKRIGDIMKNLTPFLKLYTEYVKNYETASNLLVTWRHKNSAFGKLMTDAEVCLASLSLTCCDVIVADVI